MKNDERSLVPTADDYLPMVVRDPRVEEEVAAIRAIEKGVKQYWKTVLKYRKVVCGVAFAVLGLAALYGFTATRHFTATALIRIESFEPLLGTGKNEDALQQKSNRQDYLETQIQQLRSLSVADVVLQDAEIRSAIEDKPRSFIGSLFSSGKNQRDPNDQSGGYRAPTPVLKEYLSIVSIVPVRRTMLVNIQVTHPNKIVAARAANKHAEAYIDWSRKSRIETQSMGVEFLSARASELQGHVEELEQQIAEYAEVNSIVAVNKDENITVQKMARLNELLADAMGRKVEAVNRYEQAKADVSSDASAFDDPSVQQARGELARLEVERAELSEKFNVSFPKLQQVNARIDTLKRSIKSQRLGIVRGLQTRANAASREVDALQEELESQKGLAFDLTRRQVKFNSLSRELDTTRELLLTVSKQMKEIEVAAQSKGSNIAMVDRAIVPKIPAYPRRGLTLLLGAVGGLALGLLVAFSMNALDNTIRTPEDIAAILQVASFGYIPILDDIEQRVPKATTTLIDSAPVEQSASAQETPTVTGADKNMKVSALSRLAHVTKGGNLSSRLSTKMQLAESYRLIRTNILLSRAGSVPRTILVTSALPGEGKTTVTSNLAISLASTGSRVVVIDSDLRKPSVHKKFNLQSRGFGVTDILTGQTSWRSTVIQTGHTGVSVIPCGTIPPNPAELVGSQEMTILLGELSKEFDFVIVDSAPVVPVTDTVLLAYQVDGVVFVVRSGKTPARAAHEAKVRLERAGARILGAVLNHADVRGRDYYYYSYSGSSYYGSSDERSQAA